jgi:hypothetical protein
MCRTYVIRLKVFEREVFCNIFFGHTFLAGQAQIVYTISFSSALLQCQADSVSSEKILR